MKVIGIAGPSGSGKTSLVKIVHEHYGEENCLTISSDNYYNDFSHMSPEDRSNINFDDPANLDFDLLTDHVTLLKQGDSAPTPTYDFATHLRAEERVEVQPKEIIIVEGILVLQPERLASLFDVKIFVDTNLDLCLIRRTQRDVSERGRTMESVYSQYLRHVRPMYFEHVAPCREQADIIVENNDECSVAEGNVNLDVEPLLSYLETEHAEARPQVFSLFSSGIN